MAVYLVVSVFTGVICSISSLVFFDGGFWSGAMWYMFGCWAGFALSVGLVVFAQSRRSDADNEMSVEFG